jgi:hypothetical protein
MNSKNKRGRCRAKEENYAKFEVLMAVKMEATWNFEAVVPYHKLHGFTTGKNSTLKKESV